jgi:hypothetical protein
MPRPAGLSSSRSPRPFRSALRALRVPALVACALLPVAVAPASARPGAAKGGVCPRSGTLVTEISFDGSRRGDRKAVAVTNRLIARHGRGAETMKATWRARRSDVVICSVVITIRPSQGRGARAVIPAVGERKVTYGKARADEVQVQVSWHRKQARR